MLGMGALRRHSGRGYRPEHPRTSRRAPAPPCGAAVPSAPPPSAPPAITSPLALRLCRYKRRSRGAVTGLCARNLQVLSVRTVPRASASTRSAAGTMREIVHIQAGQCGNQIGAKVGAPRGWGGERVAGPEGKGPGRSEALGEGRRVPRARAGAGPRGENGGGGGSRRSPAGSPAGVAHSRHGSRRGPGNHRTCHGTCSDAAVCAFNQGLLKFPRNRSYSGIYRGIQVSKIWIKTAVILIQWPHVEFNLDIFVYSLNEKNAVSLR